MKKIFCLTIVIVVFVSFAAIAFGETSSPFRRVKALAMTKGKLLPDPSPQPGGKTYSYFVMRNDIKYLVTYSVDRTSKEVISISQQIKGPDDRPGSATGRKMTVQYSPKSPDESDEKGDHYQLGVDESGKDSTKWRPVNWNIAWGVADKFLKETEGN